MIFPSQRFVLFCCLTTLPFGTMVYALPGQALVSLCLALSMPLIGLIDVWLSKTENDEMELKYLGSRFFCDGKRSSLLFKVGGFSEKISLRLICTPNLKLATPMHVLKPLSTEQLLEWEMVPLNRGEARLLRLKVEWASKFKFWKITSEIELDEYLKIYPNIIRDNPAVAAKFLMRVQEGERVQKTIGQGKEFEQLRNYIPGDYYSDIDWKATARKRSPITKVFQSEKTQEVYLILDHSRLSQKQVEFKNKVVPVLEKYIHSALMLCQVAQNNGDKFGLISFSDQVNGFLKANRSHAHYRRCMDQLFNLKPQSSSPQFHDIFSFCRTRIEKRSLLIFLTSLDDPVLSEQFLQSISVLSTKHVVLVNQMESEDTAPFFTGSEITKNQDITSRFVQQLRWQQLQIIDAALKKRGVKFFTIRQEELVMNVIQQYLTIKEKQII